MNAVQKRIEELHRYAPEPTAPVDLEAFWSRTLADVLDKPVQAQRTRQETPFPYMDTYDVTYQGFADTPIKGWYLLPKFPVREKLPCVVLFHGYTGGRGYPEQYASWLLMGMAVFAVDIRGQGGETGNRLANTYGMTRGWITQGILDKETCYYKAIGVDALQAVEWVTAQPEVDPGRIVVAGDSQGGGLSLLVSALSDKPALSIANIPNMCHMDFGILNSVSSLSEAAEFVSRFPEHLDKVMETLSYFDIMNLAERISIPVLVSVGLKDTVCLPETVFAAYNRIRSTKEIGVHPFTGHATGGYQNRRTVEFIRKHLSF
ncbi:acetylxylan esterase [Paenibacillus tyrfis]|uniref:acetylxylan esterase n=1 Tax=Paenibacillus tyrfis TaxID=1501230 RepID=UPI000B58C056|nr:acetylxylan esterase [Paenibacillus tyrfis]